MSERYNNVQLNGSSLPSTEPNRRNFSFDIIPAALIDNVTIAKTFTPDLPGEFTGGLVQVNTLAIPEKPLLSVSMGAGFNSISTGDVFKSNARYKSDYLFGNSREWYGSIWSADKYFDILKQHTPADRADYSTLSDEGKAVVHAMNARMPNRWEWRSFKAAPTQNYTITAGLPFDLGNKNKLGVFTSITDRHEENTDDLLEALYYSGADSLYNGKRYKFVTSTGAVANIGWERPGHKLTWRNLFNNRFTHSNMERVTYDADHRNMYMMEQYSKTLINRLWQTQLDGEHTLPLDVLFSWTADFSNMNRTAPDDRLASGYIHSEVPSPDGDYLVEWMVAQSAQAIKDAHIYYSGLEEKKTNIGANLEYPFIVAGNKQKLKAGYYGSFRRADFKQLYLTPLSTKSLEQGMEVSDLFSSDKFADGVLRYGVGGMNGNRDYYNGKQDIHAAYVMGEFTFWHKLHLTTGLRMEKGKMDVFTSTDARLDKAIAIPKDSTIVRNETDWLPAITAVYNITGNFNFRAAYSKTLARPDFRELSVGRYYNVDDRQYVRSEGALQQSYTRNVDLRFEWYPQAGEVVSISAFYKKFDKPVEMIGDLVPGSITEVELYPVNLKDATVKGLELNLRKSFGFLAPGSFLKDVYLTANASIIKGNVKYNQQDYVLWPINTLNRDRPLVGLAPYLVNLGLMYQGNVWGANFNYGRHGRKLLMSGREAGLDEYENPRDVLDLQISARFLKEKLEVKFNASDLLGQPFIRYRNFGRNNKGDLTDLGMDYNEGDWVLNKYKQGTSYSFSVGYKF
jgi:TonB-dependent receptor